jgi:hypothetical protein
MIVWWIDENQGKVVKIIIGEWNLELVISQINSVFFVLMFPSYKHKDQNVQSYNFILSFVWMWDLISRPKGKTEIEGVSVWSVKKIMGSKKEEWGHAVA